VNEINAEPSMVNKICAAKRSYDGWPCEQWAMTNGRCRKHGGRAKKGVDAPNFKHGRYSQALVGLSLHDAYTQAVADPELLALKDDIALVVSRLQQLILKLPRGDTRDAWNGALTYARRLRPLVQRLPDPVVTRADEALRSLLALLEQGASEYVVWREITDAQAHLRALIDTERKYREGLQINLTIERVEIMMAVIVDAARRTISREAVGPFIQELEKIVRLERPQSSGTGHGSFTRRALVSNNVP
jgi:hypothetical protein